MGEVSKIKNSFILLYGSGCTGKSASLATLFKLRAIRPKQRVIYLTTEKNALPGIGWGLARHNITLAPKQFYYAQVKAKQKKAFGAEIVALKKFAASTIDATYAPEGKTNANKDKYTFFIDVCSGLHKFSGIDYVTGEVEDLGNIGELEEQDILIVDGLTPIVHGIWNLIQGDRKMNNINDYQIVQKQVKDFTQELVNSLDCGLVLLAHEEFDEAKILRPAINCGQKLHGSFISVFTDTIYSYKTMANKFCWAGKKMGVETAARNFPPVDTLEQDFSLYNFFRMDGKS